MLRRDTRTSFPAQNRSRLRWYWAGFVTGLAREERWPEIVEFLGQDVARAANLEHSRGALADLLQRNRAQHKENAA